MTLALSSTSTSSPSEMSSRSYFLFTFLNSSFESKPQNNDGHLILFSLTVVKDNYP